MKVILFLIGILWGMITALTEDYGVIDIVGLRELNEIKHEKVILFYNPWDIYYQRIINEYIKTAFYFKEQIALQRNDKDYLKEIDLKVSFIKIDCSINRRIVEGYDINSCSKIILAKESTYIEFEDVATADRLIFLLMKELNKENNSTRRKNHIIRFDSSELINSFIPFNSHILLNLLQNTSSINSNEIDLYDSYASTYEGLPIYFIQCNTDACLRHYHYNRFALIRNLDNDIAINYYNSSLSKASINHFIHRTAFKPGTTLSHLATNLLFDTKNRASLLYFRNDRDVKHKEKDYHIRQLTIDNAYIISSYLVAPKYNDLHDYISTFFGVSIKSVPYVCIVEMNNTEAFQYAMEMESIDDITMDSLQLFLRKYLQGRLIPERRSEPISEDVEAFTPVRLVGKNYFKKLNERTNAIVMLFHRTKCLVCWRLFDIWKDLALSYANITFGMIDIQLNKVDEITIMKMNDKYKDNDIGSDKPVLMLYFKDKTSDPIRYSGKVSYKNINDWIMGKLYMTNSKNKKKTGNTKGQ